MNRFKILTLALLLGISFITKSQNTGPVSPEAMSFEPVDANNMVNMYTGDFSYVIPILNIPGPGGGYPIALSYHGGVTMDQEASWVGLGWNINPGAITRSVNGCPDDWTGQVQNVKGHVPPEDIDLYSVGLDVGLFKVLSVGVSYTWGAYRSVGVSAGFFVGADKSSKLGFGAGLSYDSHSGNVSASASVGIRLGENGMLGLSSNGSVSLSTFDKQRNIGAGFSLGSQGFSFSARGGGMGVGVGVPKQDNGSKNGWHHSTESSGISVPIFFVTLSFSHQKYTYWYNKRDDFASYGTLYTKNSDIGPMGLAHDKRFKMDVYEIDYDENSLKPDADVSKNNLILPAYDNYNATAQGLAGTFSPKYYASTLLTGDSYKVDADGKNEVSFYHWWYAGDTDFNVNPYFYFDSDISGYVSNLPGTFSAISSTGGIQDIRYTGNTIQSTIEYKGKTEIGYLNKRRTTGNCIEWFTNDQIIHGDAKLKGFIEDPSVNSIRGKLTKSCTNYNIPGHKEFDPDGIGGFMVTTPDGKTYHYSIPVYQREELIRKNGSKAGSYQESRKLSSYAYAWLLTAITGPDYVDMNSDGFLDNNDYGYWVGFKYGLYTNGFMWQIPYDLEGESYSTYKKGEIHFGRKQIYYLNSIETKTHTAYFIKDTRDDGLSSASEFNLGYLSYWNAYLLTDKGIKDLEMPSTPCTEWDKENSTFDIKYSYSIVEKTKPLKLDRIILCKKNGKEKANINPSNVTFGAGTLNIDVSAYFICIGGGQMPYWVKYTVPLNTNIDNIYLTSNTDLNDVKNQVIKEVNFNYSYDLCPKTPNSNAPNKGKLTLKSLELLGRNGSKTMPAYIFDYHYPSREYIKSNIDPYGYQKDYPESWSLKEITLPVGGKIRVDYEKNTFKNEAVFGNRIPIIKSWYNGDFATIKVAADIKSFIEGEVLKIKGVVEYEYYIEEIDPYDGRPIAEWRTSSTGAPVIGESTITSINLQDSTITFANPSTFPKNIDMEQQCLSISNGWLLNIRDNQNQYGGGVRVSRLSLVDDLGHEYETEYDYNKLGTNNTSGTVPYSLYYLNKKYVPYISELPSPKVVYGNVTVRQRSNGQLNPAITAYEFEAYNNAKTENLFSLEMEGQFKVINQQDPNVLLATQTGNHDGKIYARSSTLWNNLGAIGRLKSIKSLNPLDQVISKETRTYYDPTDIQIGVQQETYNSWKRYCEYYDSRNKSHSTYNFTATSRITFPSLAKGVKSELNGQYSEITNDVYDFNTGNVLSTLTTDYDGDEYRTEVLPAYKIPAYASMGLKSTDINNKNMLMQEAANISYVRVDDDWKPIGVGIQTWSNTWVDRGSDSNGKYLNSGGNFRDITLSDVWRKYKTFSWAGEINKDGTYSSEFLKYDTPVKLISRWADFNCDSVNVWSKTNEVTRYNRFSTALEVTDINGNAFSSITNLEGTQSIATATNAGYDEFTHCGFEEEHYEPWYNIYNSNVKGSPEFCSQRLSYNATNNLTGIKEGTINAHTGNYYLKMDFRTSTVGPSIRLNNRGGSYLVSVWVHSSSSAKTRLAFTYKYFPAGSTTYIWKFDAVFINEVKTTTFGEWKLFSYTFNIPYIPNNDLTSTLNERISDVICSIGTDYIPGEVAYIDDFRVQPVDASVSAYVYDPITDALTYILNNDNIATKYEYDDAGNLKATKKETPSGFKKVSEHNQGYARPLDNAFTLASEIDATTEVNIQTGRKNIWVTLNITNNDIVARDVNFTISLENAYSQNITSSIGSKQSKQVLVFFEIASGVEGNLLIAVTGDIQAEKVISINSPPTIQVVSFSVDRSEVPLGDNVNVYVAFMNVGAETGTFNFMWRHEIPFSGMDYSMPIEFELAPNDTKSFQIEYQNLSPAGTHLFGFGFINNNISSNDINVNCFDGSFPPN